MKRKNNQNKIILVTGCGGFIGFHLCFKLLEMNFKVIGIDNINNYYSEKLKKERLKILNEFKKFTFYKIDIVKDIEKIKYLFKKNNFFSVFHLAAQAGVRYSIENPQIYIETNIQGFFNIFYQSYLSKIKKFFYASSSSVYGDLYKQPFNESQSTLFPHSLYGATKLSNEVLSYSFSSLHDFNSIGLRFFTVYGPWGRPDMSIIKFIHCIYHNKKIYVFNHGNHSRSFTHVYDVCDQLISLMNNKGTKYFNKKTNIKMQSRVINIGNPKSVKLMKVIKIISNYLNKVPNIEYLPLQKGDIEGTTSSSIYKDISDHNYIDIEEGIINTINWYLENLNKISKILDK